MGIIEIKTPGKSDGLVNLVRLVRLAFLTLLSFLCALSTWTASAQELRTAAETVDRTPRGMGRIVREIQNRHGGILEGKLSELSRDLLLGDGDIVRYFEDNKSRRGATIYAAAFGGAGDKTIRLIYYAERGTEGVGGKEFSKVKDWVFTQFAAQGFASKGARLLQSAVGGDFSVVPNISDNLVEIVVHPSGSSAVDSPVAGESANFR
jgi:hypothetical protein